MTIISIAGIEITHTGPAPYRARSASDKDSDWPIWFVADAIGFNGLGIKDSLSKFLDKPMAILVADALNRQAGYSGEND